jgi:hypothetical protein
MPHRSDPHPSPAARAKQIFQEEHQRRMHETFENAAGAEQLQKLARDLEDAEMDALEASQARNDKGELCVWVKLQGRLIVTWTRNGRTLLGAFAGESRDRAVSSADEAFEETLRFVARKLAG